MTNQTTIPNTHYFVNNKRLYSILNMEGIHYHINISVVTEIMQLNINIKSEIITLIILEITKIVTLVFGLGD